MFSQHDYADCPACGRPVPNGAEWVELPAVDGDEPVEAAICPNCSTVYVPE